MSTKDIKNMYQGFRGKNYKRAIWQRNWDSLSSTRNSIGRLYALSQGLQLLLMMAAERISPAALSVPFAHLSSIHTFTLSHTYIRSPLSIYKDIFPPSLFHNLPPSHNQSKALTNYNFAFSPTVPIFSRLEYFFSTFSLWYFQNCFVASLPATRL